MGRGRSSFGGGGSRGSSSFGGGGGGRWSGGHHHTTVIFGGHGHYHSSGSPWVAVVVGGFFAFIGLITLLVGIGQCFSVLEYGKVQAVCVDNEYSQGYYYSHYNYTVDGVDYYDVRSNQGWQFKEEIGKTVEIHYLKDNPNEISEDNPNSLTSGALVSGFGLIFGGIGALVLVIGIKSLKKQKAGGDGLEDKSIGGSSIEQDRKCPYCGARYRKTSDTCPKCGASRID